MSRASPNPADPARLAAYSVLLERERNPKPPADRILDRVFGRQRGLDRRSREFATNLVYTTIRYQLEIDETMRVRGGRDPTRLDPTTRTLLRLGLCQVLRLGGVPDYAAVASTVDLARSTGKEQVCGLVNAVLRNVLRAIGKGEPPLSLDLSTVEGLAVATSHPVWIARRVLGAFGPQEGRRFLEFDNESAPPTLRVNRVKTTLERAIERLRAGGIEAEPSRWVPEGILLAAPAHPPDLPGYDLGWITVQDEAAQIVSRLVGPQVDERILDLCAGLGGKALHMAALLMASGGGQVVAADSSPGKLARLREMAGRLGVRNVRILAADGRVGAGLRDSLFDRVLVDAPCSDLGSLRRHPDVKWRRREEDLERLSRIQGELLGNASALARPGGRVVYCTCTITEEENERVVRRFLDEHPEFRLEDPRPSLPEPCRRLVGEDLLMRTYPAVDRMDGFFAARLVKASREEVRT